LQEFANGETALSSELLANGSNPIQGLAGRATLRSQRMGNRAKVGGGVIEPGLSSASALARDCQEQP